MDLTAKRLNDIDVVPNTEHRPDNELSLDDLEYVVGGLPRPLSDSGSDAAFELATDAARTLSRKAAAQ